MMKFAFDGITSFSIKPMDFIMGTGILMILFTIAVAFVLIVTGLQSDGNGLCTVGFLMIVAAMLYSPVKVYLIDRMYRK